VPVDDIVGVKVVETESEAEMACGLLRSEGIECSYRQRQELSADAFWDWREIVVHERDPERPRELLGVEAEADAPPPAA
jgi:hypothetical protein